MRRYGGAAHGGDNDDIVHRLRLPAAATVRTMYTVMPYAPAHLTRLYTYTYAYSNSRIIQVTRGIVDRITTIVVIHPILLCVCVLARATPLDFCHDYIIIIVIRRVRN